MEILIVSQYWLPENGVPQRRWAWLSEVLRSQGHQVTVIAPPPHYDRKLSFSEWIGQRGYLPSSFVETGNSQERIVRCGFFPAGRSLTVRAFSQAAIALATIHVILQPRGAIAGYKPDIIIGTVPALPTAAVTWIASKRFGKPYVVDLRDAWPDLLDESDNWNRGLGKRSLRQLILSFGPLQLVKKITRNVLNKCLRDAGAIMVTSSELARELRCREHIHKSRRSPFVYTIRNVFPAASSIDALQTRIQTGTSSDELNVLYAGTIGRAQDLRNAVEAVKIALQHGYRINLRFVGSGAAKEELQNMSRAIGSSITFVPRHPADDLVEHYQWADTALVHLADWEPLSRTVPSKLYELMEVGIHVTAVVQGEAAELVNKLGAGQVVPPNRADLLADSWSELIRDRAQLQIDVSGRNWVRKERAEEVPKLMAKVLQAAVGK